MLTCARCGRDVDSLHPITPDAIKTDVLDSIDHGEEDLAGEGDVEVCAECMDELTGD